MGNHHIVFDMFIVFAWISSIFSDCNVCDVSGVACTGLNTFKTCFDGTLGGSNVPVVSCPGGTFCNSESDSICVLSTSQMVPSCVPTNECGVCGDSGRFACINATSFGFCFGGTAVSRDFLFNCPTGSYCNVNEPSPGFCTDDATQMTCVTSTSTTVAPTIAPMNATTLCNTKRIIGRYALPHDTTCKSYYYCFVNKSSWRGQTFNCVGTTVFNADQQRCVVPTGYKCTDGRLLATGA